MESTAVSRHGTIAMEEDIESNAVKEGLIKDDTSHTALDNSGGPDDLTWNADIPYFEFTNDSAMACKTPVAAAGDAVLSSPESPWNKKPCVHESMAERLLQSASMVIMEPDYTDAPLIGYKRPDLSEVISWIRFETQNMMEPLWWTEMASIKQDKNIRYIAEMFVWFRCWKVRSGSWPSLPRCDFVLNQEISDTVNLCLAPTLAKLDLSLGELQALKVLMTLQCLTEMDPLKLALGYTCQCVESIMRHLIVLDIAFTPQAVLGVPDSTWSRSTSLEMDVSLANIYSLPLSVGSAGDMLQPEADMETTTPDAGEMGEHKEVRQKKDGL